MKKQKKPKVEVKPTDDDIRQGLDYVSVSLQSYSNLMKNLKVLEIDHINRLHDKVEETMADLYQAIGKLN